MENGWKKCVVMPPRAAVTSLTINILTHLMVQRHHAVALQAGPVMPRLFETEMCIKSASPPGAFFKVPASPHFHFTKLMFCSAVVASIHAFISQSCKLPVVFVLIAQTCSHNHHCCYFLSSPHFFKRGTIKIW